MSAYPSTSFPLAFALTLTTLTLPFSAAAQQAEGSASSAGQVRQIASRVGQPRLLVSNTEEPGAAWSRSVQAQGFTTGPSARDNTIGSVELYLESPSAAALAAPLVAIHADEAGEPGERLVSFRNPERFAAGANVFRTPFAVGLDANTVYFLVLNQEADLPQAFSMVFSGKFESLAGDPGWTAHGGSSTRMEDGRWRPNDGHALRFALYAPGADDPPAPSGTAEAVANVPASEPSDTAEASTDVSALEPSGTPEAVAEVPPPPASSAPPSEIVRSDPPPTPPGTSNDDDDDDTPPPLPPASSQRRAETVSTAPPPEPPTRPRTSRDDDDVPAPLAGRTGKLILGTVLAGVALSGRSGDDASPPAPLSVVPPPPPPPPLSGDATLSDLAVTYTSGTAVGLTPGFSPAMTSYSAMVANSVATVTILPMTSHANAEMEYLDGNDMVLDDADSGMSDFQVNLGVGANTFKVKVTAENDEDLATYRLAIDRAMAVPDQVTGVRVEPYVEALGVTWDVVRSADLYKVQWKLGSEGFESGGDRELMVNGGGNSSMIRNLVSGSEYVLRVIATRGGVGDGPPSMEMTGTPLGRSDDATLSGLRVTDTADITIPLTPMFSSAMTSYSASVANSVATVTILPTTNDANATVQYLDGNDMVLGDADSGALNFQANLAVGANTVKVKVAAGDGVATETYALTLRRAIAPPAQVMSIRVLPGPNALIVLWEAVSDADGYRLQWKSGKEEFESGGDREAIVSDGNQEIHTILNLLAGTEYTLRLIATRNGAKDGLPSNEEKGTPYAQTRDVPGGSDGGSNGGGNSNDGDDSNSGDEVDTDESLTDLEVTDPDDADVPLDPAFASNRETYTASVANTVTWVTFKPTTSDPNSTVAYEDGSNQPLTDADGNRGDFQVNLDEGANTVKLRVTPPGATTPGTYTVTITRAAAEVVQGNTAPTFSASTATRSFEENLGDGRSAGVDIGAPVTADDADNDSLTYTLEGTDEARFEIGSSSGQISTRSGTNYDRESMSSYSVVVRADDGRGGNAAIPVTITVTDVEEKPKKPSPPTVERVSGNTTALYVTWTAPSNTGRPRILGFDLQYREGNSGPWYDGPQDQTGRNASITDLSPNTGYQVQVLARNADGDGPWSDSGSATTSTPLPETCSPSENANVRLADGFTPKEGRVELCADDPDDNNGHIWGTVCDDYWTDDDAAVVCKALGYYNSEPIGGRFRRSYFGSGTLPILLDDLICDGDEADLLQCLIASGGLAGDAIGDHNCLATEIVGVRCLTRAEFEQHEFQIQPDPTSDPVTLSVADTSVTEAAGAMLEFPVTLSGTSPSTVTVEYTTVSGTATSGEDFVATSGTLTFTPGQTSKSVRVSVMDDLIDESEIHGERMTLRLSNPVGAEILDGVAYGYIDNSDPLPKAWLARFGRAAADQAVEAIGGRMMQSGPRNSELTVAGQRLDISGTVNPSAAMAARDAWASPWAAPAAPGMAFGQPGAGAGIYGAGPGFGGVGSGRGYSSGGSDWRRMLSGTSFQWALGADEAADGESASNWTAWGEGAASRFSGVEDKLSLDGEVATGTVGVDHESERWMTGVAVAFSRGEGAFAATGDESAGGTALYSGALGGGALGGDAGAFRGAAADGAAVAGAAGRGVVGGLLETTLTTVYPYARYAVNDRLSVWGVLGYGQGELRLIEGRAGSSYDTDTGMLMGALGARGVILNRNGFELALRTDAMRVRTYSDAVTGLAGATAETGRIRALLQGSRMFGLGSGRSLEPSLEFGLRSDSGAAETGRGIELGAGVRYTDAELGLSIEARARGLVAHQDSAYEEWGAWASIRLDPGESGRGVSVSLSPTWGAAFSGMDQLWNSTNRPQYAAGSSFDTGGRLTAELGYGVGAFHGQGLGTWYLGLDQAGGDAQRWRLGRRWQLGSQLHMSVEGARSEFGLSETDHAISLQGLLIW